MEQIEDIIDRSRGVQIKRHKRKKKRDAELRDFKKDIKSICKKHGCPEPGGFLAEVMCGNDPRFEQSFLLDMIEEIDDRGYDSRPTVDEWHEIRDFILETEYFKKHRVPLDASMDAAKNLAKNVYVKPTSKTDIRIKGDLEHTHEIGPLTKKEIKKFDKWFKKEY